VSAGVGAHGEDMSLRVIVCVECRAVSSTPSVRGWRGFRVEDASLGEPPELAFYCPSCAVSELGRPLPVPKTNGRRWRDANKGAAMTFRVTLTAVPLSVADEEIASAFDVVSAVGGSGVSVLRGGDDEQTRVEFDLVAQNDGHARRLALEALETLEAVTPSAPGGWVLAAVDLTWT
jgi:hypothetical protein